MTNNATPKTSFCTVYKQRKHEMVLFPDDGKFCLSNFGFEDDGGDDDKKESRCGNQLGSKESLGLSILLDFWKSRQWTQQNERD